MRILLKCPTRSRPTQFLSVLRKYVDLANRPDLLGVCVSCDSDDATMTPADIQYAIKNATHTTAWTEICYGNNKTKIEAVNANMDTISWVWDIVIVVSDDMSPQIKGYDDVLRSHMMAKFPDTNGILWVNDGTQGAKLNTISILGRKMYTTLGHIYHPAYKSLFCDTEFTDLCKGSLASKCAYIPYVLIRHEHPGTGFPERMDALYARNNSYWNEDMHMYISRKTYEFDWSILIPTIPGREDRMQGLIRSIHERRLAICPDLRIEICVSFDNREKSIGVKRQELLEAAKGKYMSFVDDDDELTAAYFEDALETIKGSYHCCRLRGQMSQYTFTHTTAHPLDGPMCIGDVFMRPPNHLNVLLSDVGKMMSFKNLSHGEDFDWALQLARSGYLETEYRSDESRIHYIYNLGARTIHPKTVEWQRTSTYSDMLKAVTRSEPAIVQPVFTPPTGGLRLSAKGFVSK